ncbi:hypothetical protein GL213_09740 [Halogeometricum borinquense]|uniref:Uncharacterized protein n=1 Tax=Halogeometricum borinquense TaxID=60847 RepID=A0A6C0ULQ8_9EURY|nr:hypothetical protein [Halogeometricum borinquense]QIB73868.1 hypothetical protein G3I44_05905 [Halogeometricum borinquense]QIQ76770.1 hypothetical protein GL213_09740 [Halogeometricum borinquense]
MDQGDGANTVQSDAPELASALDNLKQRGSALLVVGSVPAEVYRRASARMLGDGELRRRLLVTGVSDGKQDSRLDAIRRQTPEWTRIIEFETTARSTAAVSASDPTISSPDLETAMDAEATRNALAQRVDGDIIALGREITKIIEQFESIAGGMTPAELRLAFDCLPVLLAEYDLETAFQFSHILANHVRTVNGMVHFWLPREKDDNAALVLEPLFDATVELRLDGTELQQRWHFRDADITSDWLVLG